MSRKSTVIYKQISKQDLEKIISYSCSHSDALRRMGYVTMSGNLTRFKEYVKELGISTAHFLLRGTLQLPSQIKEEFMFVKNSTTIRGTIKRYILKHHLLKEECFECGQKPLWKGKKLVLILDHINGIPNDNRLENLRFLCPNCNSQMDTFSSKKGRTTKKTPEIVPEQKKEYLVFQLKKEDLLKEIEKSLTIKDFFNRIKMSKSDLKAWAMYNDIEFDELIISVLNVTRKNRIGGKIFLRDIPKSKIIGLLQKHGTILGAAKELGVSDRGLQKFLEKSKIDYENLVVRQIKNDKNILELNNVINEMFDKGIQPKEISQQLGISIGKISSLKKKRLIS